MTSATLLLLAMSTKASLTSPCLLGWLSTSNLFEKWNIERNIKKKREMQKSPIKCLWHIFKPSYDKQCVCIMNQPAFNLLVYLNAIESVALVYLLVCGVWSPTSELFIDNRLGNRLVKRTGWDVGHLLWRRLRGLLGCSGCAGQFAAALMLPRFLGIKDCTTLEI